MNKVLLTGRLSKDPELRKTNSGSSVASFTIAVDNRTKDAQGNRTTSFIPCTAWNGTADLVAKYLHKGNLIGVDGTLAQRSYENRQGQKVNVIEVNCESVDFLEPKSNNAQTGEKVANQSKQEENEPVEPTELTANDDDLPF